MCNAIKYSFKKGNYYPCSFWIDNCIIHYHGEYDIFNKLIYLKNMLEVRFET